MNIIQNAININISDVFATEQEILNLPHSHLIFIDEVGDSFVHYNLDIYKNASVFPVLTIMALIITKLNYQDILMPGIDEIKERFFKDKRIYFHSRQIRKKDGIFKIFLNSQIYHNFKDIMDHLLEKSSIKLISASINKINMVERIINFQKQHQAKYNIGDIYLKNVDYVLERVGHFLKNQNGKIIFESRGKKESKRIQGVLTDAKKNGTFYHNKDRFRNIDEKILFFKKTDNINGLQAVDYCAYPFARHAKNPLDKDNKFFDILRQYVYQGDYSEYGLKEWP